MKRRSKILAAVLAVCLTVTMVPVISFAAETGASGLNDNIAVLYSGDINGGVDSNIGLAGMAAYANEMKTKSTMIKPNKCATCGAQISLPAAHFLCQHSYHIACLNANTNDDSNVMECPKCKIDMLNLSKRLQNADEERKNIPKFKEDLKQNKRKFEFMASKFGSGLFKLRDPKILTS